MTASPRYFDSPYCDYCEEFTDPKLPVFENDNKQFLCMQCAMEANLIPLKTHEKCVHCNGTGIQEIWHD